MPVSKFCWSSWMPQEEWAGLLFSPFLWFCEDGDQVWDAIFTVAQPFSQVLSEFSASTQSLSVWARSTIQAQVHCSNSATQSLGMQCELGVGMQFQLDTQSLLSAAQITLGVSQLLLKSSLQSSCPPFLTSTWIFTQTNFPTTLENIRVTV